MRGTTRPWMVAGLLGVIWAGSALAQQPDAAPRSAAAADTAGIERSLERVASALEAWLEFQKTDLLLKRIEMRERRIAPIEEELRKRQGDLISVKAELERLETVRREWEDRMADAAKTDESVARELRSMQEQFEMAYSSQSSQREALELRVRTLEDELAERREWIQDLEALLLERVDDR